jgi:membrane protein
MPDSITAQQTPREPLLNSETSGLPSSNPKDHTVGHIDPNRQHVWNFVAASPLHNLWDFQGTPPLTIVKRTFHAFNEDNLLSRAAELGYYFLFALFPTLVSAAAIVGLIARSAADIYVKLLNYLALVVPHDAFQMVLDTFNQTTLHASGGKIVLGIVAAVWSASVGFTAIQDTLNTVYKVKETRPYWKVRGSAMLVTVLLSLIVTTILSSLLAGSYFAHLIRVHLNYAPIASGLAVVTHIVFGIIAAALLILLFAVIYYYAPDVKVKRWRWLTPGGAIAITCWIIASIGLRVYLYYSNSFTVTYGSLGAVIILLTWFYVTGLMLLLGAEINSEIEAAVAERKLKAAGAIPEHATTDPKAPVAATPA